MKHGGCIVLIAGFFVGFCVMGHQAIKLEEKYTKEITRQYGWDEDERYVCKEYVNKKVGYEYKKTCVTPVDINQTIKYLLKDIKSLKEEKKELERFTKADCDWYDSFSQNYWSNGPQYYKCEKKKK